MSWLSVCIRHSTLIKSRISEATGAFEANGLSCDGLYQIRICVALRLCYGRRMPLPPPNGTRRTKKNSFRQACRDFSPLPRVYTKMMETWHEGASDEIESVYISQF